MRVRPAICRPVVFAVLVAALLAGPQQAWAAKDWWGWLEEFSGPGPFNGFELSAEIICINLAAKDQVSVQEIEKKFPALIAAGQAVDRSLVELGREADKAPAASRTRLSSRIADLRSQLTAPGEVDWPALLEEIDKEIGDAGNPRAAFNTLREALDRKQQVASQVAVAAMLGGNGSPQAVNARTTRTFSAPGWKSASQSCRGAQAAIERDRQTDRQTTATFFSAAGISGAKSPADVVVHRSDWQTGIVVNAGGFWSIENQLFDPEAIRDNEPQLRIIPIELLAHSKVSSSIDIGAGVGVALFHTDFRNDPWAPTKSAAFYVVPLSVVVRPARLFTNAHWASTFGYRVGIRYFGDLDAADFGAPAGTYKQHGEFVWGAAVFIDLVALFGR